MSRIFASFKKPATAPIPFRANLDRLTPIVQHLQQTDPFGKEWFLMGDTEQESYLYLVFDETGHLTTAAEAVLETKFKEDQDARYLGAWNGQMEDGKEASLVLHFGDRDWPRWTFKLEYPEEEMERLGGYQGILTLLQLIARKLTPRYITMARYQYCEHQVFEDRPGVGWMLYLPKVLTIKQVPEARALVPVMNDDKKQIGTIIVSVTDEAFSDENPEHVKIANAIEIRLVDQDLLPRFVDM
jgi:hypothetical protein